MTIDLLRTTDNPMVLNKHTSSVSSHTGTLKEGSDVIDPVILMEISGFPSSANYAHIPAFGRYYYIRDIKNVYNNMWSIEMHVDVLKTYASGILASPCIIAKTASNDFNLYIPDPNFKCQQNTVIGMQSFPSGFDTNNSKFYLTFFG